MTEYELRPAVLDDEWDEFVQASPHGSVYALSGCLQRCRDRPTVYYCMRGGRIEAAVLLARTSPGDPDARSELIIYNGIMSAPRPGRPNDAQIALDRFHVTEWAVGELARHHAFLEMQLSPAFIDIRPFLWHNFGTSGARFAVDVRYTSYLDISDCASDEVRALGRARRSRRREVRDARVLGIQTREVFDPTLCVRLYGQTMGRQRLVVPEPVLKEMHDVMCGLHQRGQGRMFVAYDRHEVPASAVFLGIDRKRAYGMFGGSDPTMRTSPSGTAVLWDAFRALARSGVTEVDFEGVNSPRRGWFKLSFGGTLLPYYRLTLGLNVGRL